MEGNVAGPHYRVVARMTELTYVKCFEHSKKHNINFPRETWREGHKTIRLPHLEVLKEAPAAVLHFLVLSGSQAHDCAAANLQLVIKALQQGAASPFLEAPEEREAGHVGNWPRNSAGVTDTSDRRGITLVTWVTCLVSFWCYLSGPFPVSCIILSFSLEGGFALRLHPSFWSYKV